MDGARRFEAFKCEEKEEEEEEREEEEEECEDERTSFCAREGETHDLIELICDCESKSVWKKRRREREHTEEWIKVYTNNIKVSHIHNTLSLYVFVCIYI